MSLDETQSLRVGTFNIRWANPDDGAHRWEHRQANLLALLRRWQPDVLGLQEPFRHQLDLIADALPDFGVVGVGREDGRSEGEFCPIFYRRSRLRVAGGGTFWLSESPDTPGSRAWGAWHPRICTWVRLVDRTRDVAFFVYNLHLDNESQQARENGLELVMAHMRRRPTPDPVLLMGDFNATPDNPAIRRLQASESPVPVNALASAGGAIGTFHGFTGQAQGGPIDHICLSPEWQVRDAQVLPSDGVPPFPSDHFPVSVTLLLTTTLSKL